MKTIIAFFTIAFCCATVPASAQDSHNTRRTQTNQPVAGHREHSENDNRPYWNVYQIAFPANEDSRNSCPGFVLSKEEIADVVKVMKNASFDNKKLEIANLCLKLRPADTTGLAAMAKVFSFDDDRLKFLTNAYPYCVDPQNYSRLEKAFSFRSNYLKLMENVRKMR